jgi:4-hydroxy-tetrahydrodipicolinate synthase
MSWFKGTGTALITPFHTDDTIDESSFEKCLAYQIEHKANACIVLGTTGESPVVSFEERSRLIQMAKSMLQGKMPLIVGTGSNNPAVVLANNHQAKELGADGILLVNPYYNKSTQEGLVDYFSYIAAQSSLPIMLYNVPSRTGMNVLPATIIKIHQTAPIVSAVKEASGDISQIAQLMEIKPDSLSIFSGNDDQTIPIMALGGIGVVSVASNVILKEMKSMTDALLQENYISARQIFFQILPLLKHLFHETNPIPVKAGAFLLGLCQNIVRRPLIPISTNLMTTLRQDLERLGYPCALV